MLIFIVLADLVLWKGPYFEMGQWRCFWRVQVLDTLHRSNASPPPPPSAFTTSPCRFLWDVVAVTTNWQFPFHSCCGCNQLGFNMLFIQWYHKVPVSCGGFLYPSSFYRRKKSSPGLSSSVTHEWHRCVFMFTVAFDMSLVPVNTHLCLLVDGRVAHSQEKAVVDGGRWW